MAKKIKFKIGVEVTEMSKALKKRKIEHVTILTHRYEKYIIVKNIYKDTVRKICGDRNILRIKSVRHYENICITHINNYYDGKSELLFKNVKINNPRGGFGGSVSRTYDIDCVGDF